MIINQIFNLVLLIQLKNQMIQIPVIKNSFLNLKVKLYNNKFLNYL